jgi:hypothetical protein
MGTWAAARGVIWALFFGSVSPIKTDATFFALYAETGFLRFT